MTKLYLWSAVIILSLCCNKSFSQSYGLGFFSHEVVQDQRTGLDLSPGKNLCFEDGFDLSFDLNFLPNKDDYFGYILRLVVNDSENIDLLYDNDFKEKHHFKVIVGNKFSKIAFEIPPATLYHHWNQIKLRFDAQKSQLTLFCGQYIGKATVNLKKGSCFKILFGANEYQQFKTSDNPPMKIRNIKITEDGELKYHWPLDEYDGNRAKELVGDNKAGVNRALWIKKMHYDWQRLGSFVVKGPASTAFNTKKDEVYIVERDSLKTFSVSDTKLKSLPFANKLTLLRGNYSLYDESSNRLLNFYADQKTVSVFDSASRTWSKDYNPKTPITDNWLFNKFYSPKDSSLYMIAGYGHFIYKNQVNKYHFPTGTWQQEQFKGDVFTPRYLAALGQSGNGAYIIGGYGSTTGKQMLNPRNLYDLLYFDMDKKTIKKRYELKVGGEDFVFANSLIINEKERTFYGLIFPRHRYDSKLQLIVGSLDKPEYKLSGSKIPYRFHDINSYSDLYYSRSSKRFIAVTTFRDSTDKTHVNIYALNSPPLDAPDKLFAEHSSFWYWFSGLFLVAMGIIFFVFRNKKATKPVYHAQVQSFADPGEEVKETALIEETVTGNKSSIFLFGDLQVFDDDGQQITKQFTPLIKELFLVVLLYTIRWERGISSDKLKELLWFDKSNESARNNRSVNIAKLKSILDKISNCQISKETGYWRINIDTAVTYTDYQEYVNIIKDKSHLDHQKIRRLATIIKRGPFLPTVNYEWMDSFKAEISNEIIDSYLHFSHSVGIESDPELLIELSSYIFYFDSVNEEAMVIKCKALVHLGKHSIAKNTYENFCKEYKLLYGDEFQKSFSEVLVSTPGH
ncbi:hypothetical protein GCM10022289_11130 [Pedobacter jeongneungensis]|uniref:Galactose oxidase n=1 Tax=Pedobacter jeongneungensis TaxID=947309 RepID=A0ABP8B885_9SPHI